MKKRLLLVALISILMLSLVGCGREVDEIEDESTESEMKPIATVVEPSVTDASSDEPKEKATPEPTEVPTPEPTEEPVTEMSVDNTNPAFYKWVTKETEEDDIAWYVENFGVSEAELRTWDDEQWQTVTDDWLNKATNGRYDNEYTESTYKRIGYTVSEGGMAFSEEYRMEAETVYDVLVEAEFYEYHDEIGKLYINGVLIEDDPQNVPINNGDEISIEVYRTR